MESLRSFFISRRRGNVAWSGCRCHSYHVMGVVLVYCYLLGAPFTASSASTGSASSRVGSSSTGSPYNLTISSVEARAATVQWDLTPAVLTPSATANLNGNNSSGSSVVTYGPPPPILGFTVTIKPLPVVPGTSGGPGWGSGDPGGSSGGHGAPAGGPGGLGPSGGPQKYPGGSQQSTGPSDDPSFIGMSLAQPRVVSLESHRRSFRFQDLTPRTEYKVNIVALTPEGAGNVSETLIFTTLNESKAVPRGLPIRPTEAVLVVLILIAWFCAIALFLNKWGKIRIIQPREPRYKHSPKNLETIKVVKKPTDSVIHKHYTRQLSRTMVARENKRIERMNTMPNIKVNIESLAPPIERIDKKFPTMPEIEMENFSEQGESQT